MSTFLHAIGYGLVLSGIMGLAATGLSLQVSVTNFINFAYGDYLALGGYLALTVREHGVNMVASTVAACVGTALFSYLTYRVLFGPLRERGMKMISVLIISVGLSLILESVLAMIWGPSQQSYGLRASAPHHIGPFLLTDLQLYTIGFAAIGLLALHLGLRYTTTGKAMRAMADNMSLARVSMIATDKLTGLVWAIMGAMAGLSGVMLAISVASFTPAYGFTFLFLIFAVVIIGGIGSIYGTMIGSLIVGVGISVTEGYISAQYSDAIVFGLLIAALLVRPQGLFGGKLVAQ